LLISDRQKTIIKLLADGEFHSGTELAEGLGVSRSAIWKQLNGLISLGLSYTGVSGKGYRLNAPLELLTEEQIYQALNDQAKTLIDLFEIHDQINSTNTYLMGCARNNAPSGFICLAESQSNGKGRRGRDWVSPYGSNIYMSILWRFKQNGLASISGLSLAVGVAIVRALRQHQIGDIELKWPNDIYYEGKKLGGILVEASGESDGPCAIVIGLGVNFFLPETGAKNITQPWTDLTKITGQNRLPRNQITATMLNLLLPLIAGYEKDGIQAYIDEWRSYDCLKQKPATLHIGKHRVDGIVEGVDKNGMLIMKHSDGTLQTFASGEVSFSSS
jgi:BirA family biotin operon repressor/biotin-[acetyl-CoA-carboxylase] ligase